jgi:hypothetical protein
MQDLTLTLLLSNGVTVIAAHCALPFYSDEPDTDFVELIELMRESEQKGWVFSDNYFSGVTTIKTPVKYTIFISFIKGFEGMCKSRRDLQSNVVNS